MGLRILTRHMLSQSDTKIDLTNISQRKFLTFNNLKMNLYRARWRSIGEAYCSHSKVFCLTFKVEFYELKYKPKILKTQFAEKLKLTKSEKTGDVHLYNFIPWTNDALGFIRIYPW